VVTALVRGGAVAAAPVLLFWGAWLWRRRPSPAEAWTQLEILIAFWFLAVGATSLSVRMTLAPVARLRPGPLSGLLPAAGALAYGLTARFLAPGEPPEMILSLLLIGGALLVLGLNRLGELPPEVLRAPSGPRT
jgi:hypothetical protein